MRLLAHRALVHAARLHYVQPHRGYHNAGHLDELIVLAREHTPDLDEAEQLALLFHDAVYVPGAAKGDNERLSAMLMKATVATLSREDDALSILADDLARAGRIIEATAHAAPPAAEAARICDLDLWRLAAPWDAFQQHALGIRHEYLHLVADEPAFWAARNAFYESMLAKPRLFATDYFVDGFEETARSNMRRALALAFAHPPRPARGRGT
jgi:predicted metal-dependent HD superfamily phosphohydrolase